MYVSILDPSVLSRNLGDHIIKSAVIKHIGCLFDRSHLVSLPTHDRLGPASRRIIKDSSFALVGGSNLLSSRMNKYRQWKVGVFDALFLRNNFILAGVGWWQYQQEPNAYTRFILRSLLCREALHSVRDSYSVGLLKAIGIDNVINTGCPTMWDLTPRHCESIPVSKSQSVVFTLSGWKADRRADRSFLEVLGRNYKYLHFWPQEYGDLEYFRDIRLDRDSVNILPPRLESYDSFLSCAPSVDYVGLRLHGGIRALQHGCRSIVLAVDNRALEISKDTGLPVVQRTDLSGIERAIGSSWPTKINIDSNAIEAFKSQFCVSGAMPGFGV